MRVHIILLENLNSDERETRAEAEVDRLSVLLALVIPFHKMETLAFSFLKYIFYFIFLFILAVFVTQAIFSNSTCVRANVNYYCNYKTLF